MLPKRHSRHEGILEILLPFFPRASLTPVRIRSLSLSCCLANLKTIHPAPASISGIGTRLTRNLIAFTISASQCGIDTSVDPCRLPFAVPDAWYWSSLGPIPTRYRQSTRKSWEATVLSQHGDFKRHAMCELQQFDPMYISI